MNVYCIFDKVAGESGPLFEAQNDAVACRMLLQMNKNSPELLDDYDLYQVGEYERDKVELYGFNDMKRLLEVRK